MNWLVHTTQVGQSLMTVQTYCWRKSGTVVSTAASQHKGSLLEPAGVLRGVRSTCDDKEGQLHTHTGTELDKQFKQSVWIYKEKQTLES